MKQPLLGLTLTELQTVVKNLGLPGLRPSRLLRGYMTRK